MTQFNKTLDLGWGNPYFLLKILDLANDAPKWTLNAGKYSEIVYENNSGNEGLLEKCKEITEKLTRSSYKYYLITNGATQAINTVMRTWGVDRELAYCVTGKLGYPFYPEIINKNYLWHKKVDLSCHSIDLSDEMVLIDSPSNPLGEQFGSPIYLENAQNIVWDAVYHNPIYSPNMFEIPNHEVYINSFSKLLGVTGARVGWLATNDKHDYERFLNESLLENATVSQPSQELILDTLEWLDLNDFMNKGRAYLNRNREIIDDISGLVGTPVQEVGMFYCAQVDYKLLKLLDRANIKYVKFDSEDGLFVRLNIGQTSDILQEAVKRIKKIDGIKSV